jgi:5-oxopent-3-ene-1,2,5-tricarboxylate decarboxylase/2-hydroxyhepta-2,4-diene-1,7-dioate isomerase
MKRARVIYRGRVCAGVPHGDRVQLEDGQLVTEDQLTWLPPIEPRTIFAVGLNYADHAQELAFKPQEEPLIFLKGPNAVAGHRTSTIRPRGVDFMHYECELAVVIGRPLRRASPEAALAAVAGYTVANDYAVRDHLENYYRPNLRAKNRDAATLIGPWLVDAGDVADPLDLQLRTLVNGKLTQSGSTRDMIFGVGPLLSHLSAWLTLGPGDIILTGTPKGVVNVNAGDEIVTEIDGIGRLVGYIEAEAGSAGAGR